MVKVNDSRRDVWPEFGVISHPSWAFINDDGSIEVVSGGLSDEDLSARLDALVAS